MFATKLCLSHVLQSLRCRSNKTNALVEGLQHHHLPWYCADIFDSSVTQTLALILVVQAWHDAASIYLQHFFALSLRARALVETWKAERLCAIVESLS